MDQLETERRLQTIRKRSSSPIFDEPEQRQMQMQLSQKSEQQNNSESVYQSIDLIEETQTEIEKQTIEALNKRIGKLRNVLDQRKNLNKKMLGSLRQKKREMTELVDEVNLVYVKVDKLSMDFEEGLMETTKLKQEAQASQKRLSLMDKNLMESYNETEKIRTEIQEKEEAVKDLINKLRQLREAKKLLKEEGERLIEDNFRLKRNLDNKENEKKNVSKVLETEVKKLQGETDKAVKEKEEVYWNAETLKELGGQGRVEFERLQSEIEMKSEETQKLQSELELIKKERDDAQRMYTKMLQGSESRCQIF